MTQITEQLFLGSWKDAIKLAEDIKVGKEDGEKWEILTAADNSPVIGQHHFPITDPASKPEDPQLFHEALQKLEELLGQGQKVLVHCVSGANRSVSVVLAYLAKKGESPVDALPRLAKLRSGIRPYNRWLEAVCREAGLGQEVVKALVVPIPTETEATVHKIYSEILGRQADPDGLAHYGELLARGALHGGSLREVLMNSEEYCKRHQGVQL